MWAASREPRRGGAGAGRGRRRRQRALDRARGAGARVPAQRRPELAVPARRLDGADVRGARRARSRRPQALAELGRRPERRGAAGDRHPAQGRRARQRGPAASARRALVFAIINSHFDLAAMLLDKGADPNVADLSGMAALYAAVDMNSMQWTQGRPAPIFTDRLDAVDLVKKLLAEGRQPERAPEAAAAQAPPRRRHDAQLRRGRDAADARGADQRRGGDEGAARRRRRSVPDAAGPHHDADDRRRPRLRRPARRGHPHRGADARGRGRGGARCCSSAAWT